MKKTGKIHWIRKHRMPDILQLAKHKYYFDAHAACGQFAILNGTVFRDKVTCKTCLKIMRKNEKA